MVYFVISRSKPFSIDNAWHGMAKAMPWQWLGNASASYNHQRKDRRSLYIWFLFIHQLGSLKRVGDVELFICSPINSHIFYFLKFKGKISKVHKVHGTDSRLPDASLQSTEERGFIS